MANASLSSKCSLWVTRHTTWKYLTSPSRMRRNGADKKALRDYANRLKEKLRNIEGNTLTLAKATQFVKEQPGFEDTLEVQRFATKGRYIKFFL